MKRKYKELETECQVLRLKSFYVKLKPGEYAEELVDKLESLIKRFAESGDWEFLYDVEG